jgi:hypothetical protein
LKVDQFARERVTQEEAEEVLRRFHVEEELRQREREASAMNPSIADLAEGLGVPPERVSELLAQVRADSVASHAPPVDLADQRRNVVPWLLGAVAAVIVISLLAFVAAMFTATRVEVPAPAPIETPAPDQPSPLPPGR